MSDVHYTKCARDCNGGGAKKPACAGILLERGAGRYFAFLFGEPTITPHSAQVRWGSAGLLQFGHATICTFFRASWDRRRPTFDFE